MTRAEGMVRAMTDCLNCKSLEAYVRAGEEAFATCSDCGTQWRRKAAPRARQPRTARDLPALAARAAIRAIDLDPSSRLRGDDGPEDLDTSVRAERSRGDARAAERRLAELRAHGPDGERFARALWLAYGARGPVLNERESLAVVIARECLAFEPGDWSVVIAERRRITERAAARKLQVPDAPRLVATVLGNAILGAAVAAYDLDEWTDWRPRRAEPEVVPADEPARVRRAREMRARFDARCEEST